jgi:hypothetical protein
MSVVKPSRKVPAGEGQIEILVNVKQSIQSYQRLFCFVFLGQNSNCPTEQIGLSPAI